ncbi:MAG: hypothetical protein LQ337_000711 [Flavoplaca oasis]|nr:MAG: hypothetical protein LQ337_000711 [Flavoplaca oasis]
MVIKAFLYPLKGIIYFARHPFLYPLLRAQLLLCVLLSAFVLTNLFFWTYLPQVAFLAIFHGRKLAFLNATFLVLGEAAAITALLFECFFADETLVDVFDATLINEGCSDLVATSRVVDPSAGDPVKQLGKPVTPAVYSPFSLRQIIEFIVFLPLNFIPVAGTPLFLVMTGLRAGPLHHYRYLHLLGLTKKERDIYLNRRKLRYTWFGFTALILQLVPVLSMLFLLTTATGSALWASKLEEERKSAKVLSDPAPAPTYQDDPT